VLAKKDKDEKNKLDTSSLDAVAALSERMLGGMAKHIAERMPSLKEKIRKSNLRLTPVGLVALALLFSFTAVAAPIVMLVLSLTVLRQLPSFIVLATVPAPLIMFFVFVSLPRISQSSRASALDNELAFVIGFIVVLAGGGVTPVASLRRIANMADTFPATSKEARRILLDIDVFGLDPTSALEKAAATNPNRTFSEFLYGYTTIIKTGGDLVTFLNGKLKDTYEMRTTKVKKASDTIAMLAEGYVTITAVLGISLFVLFQTMSLISHSSAGVQGIVVFGLVAVPMFSFMFLYVLDAVQAKFPYVDYRPYKVFGMSAAVGLGLYFAPLPISQVYHVSIALIGMTLWPSYIGMKLSNEKRSLEAALPSFIRDISEGRKIGLSPEATIQGLVNKNYGALSKHVNKMGAQLSWGISLSQVIRAFVEEVHSWVTREAGLLIAEVIDVGGGTVQSFSDMSDFTRKINDLEKEKSGSLRMYTFICYFSAIMVVVTTFVMAYFMMTPINLGGAIAAKAAISNVPNATVDLLLTISIFESWVIGIVAGKMGGGSVSDGFKHALALVVVSTLTIYIAQSFVHIAI
jgi:flagellar protein FlaJ